MKRAIVVALLGLAACGPRQVEVRTAPASENSTANLPAINVTNALTQAVMVYVTSGGTDTFIRRVDASSTQRLPVQGITAGSTVTLKAVTVDGTRTFTRNTVLSGTVNFPIP
jgi:hypothetical protein